MEPGPVVLVTSAWKGNTNIMTMGWHMVLEFSPSLVACCISNANHSFEMIRRSHECVINLPTTDLVNEVIGIGNLRRDRQIQSVRAHASACHKCERPVDQGVLCEFRMPPDQRQPDFEVRPIHLGGS